MQALRVAAVCLLIATLSGPVAHASQRQVNENRSVSDDVEVEIYNVVGSVTVTGWERREISVQGTLGEGADRLDFESDGDGAEIRVVIPRRRRRDPERDIGETHLEIMVPRRASLQIETLAASVVVQGVDGSVAMESSAGDLLYSGAGNEIEAGSAAGTIEVESSAEDAAIDIEGVAGNVAVQFVSGEISATTLTGDLRVVGGRLDGGDFESVSGSLYFEGELGSGAEVDFENFNGDIELILPADTAGDFDVSTYSGSIETEFGFEGTSVKPSSPEQEAEFTLGGGNGTEVSIETFSGVVRVRRR